METIEINKHLDCVEESIKWINNNLVGDKKEQTYSKLVDQRRELNKIKYALSDNPAAAIYGESQKGKSYLVSSLLSSPNQPFNVIDAKGNNYDFKLDINPIGQDKESTSVVTRFSINYNWINEDFPVKIQLLSIVDIILLLSDTYYNDLKNHNLTSLEEIKLKIKSIENEFKSIEKQQQIITEDSILNIRDYFKKHFQSKANNIISINFFEILSKNIHKIAVDKWAETFSVLWNNNPLLISLFKNLISKYKEIDFTESLYVPYKAVLRKHGTLLDVRRLEEISSNKSGSETEYLADTDVFYKTDSGKEVVKSLKKSFLCALTAEVIFKLPENLKKEKEFLSNTDLLDFPGARARLDNNESAINQEEIPKMLLRGKVAYLFNKYADNFKINTLLFCHDKIQASQRYMPDLLNSWLNTTVGETTSVRKKFIDKSIISPLFIISTKFNLDLKITQNDSPETIDPLNDRWDQRFSKILMEELINVDMFDWFENWTEKNEKFNNIYLLRDYYFSSDLQNQLFKGFNESGSELEEIIPSNYPEFKTDLKKSFLNHDFIKSHFKNPEKSWDEATSINKDGTELIIENLTIATENINKAREDRFTNKLNDLAKNLKEELKKNYHSGDSDDLLIKAKESAGRLQAKLDISYGRAPYFFAEMINSLLLSEGDVYNHYRNIINNLDSKLDIKFNEYSTIRMRVPNLNVEYSFNENLAILAETYEFKDLDKCEEYFKSENIDLEDLFYGQFNKLKMFSIQLAESLKTYWLEECRNNISITNSENVGLNKSDFEEILLMFDLLYEKLNITNKIAKTLESYVDRYDNVEIVQEMIADISAETINSFVNNVGFSFYKNEDIVEFKNASKENNLGLQLEHQNLKHTEFNKKDVGDLFENIDNLPKILNDPSSISNMDYLKMIPSFSNYKKWNDLLKFGFIAVCDIPNYDVKANELLGELKNTCSTISY